MRKNALMCVAIAATLFPVASWADDPKDPAMRNADARARDAAITRQLNMAENDTVQRRGVHWSVVQGGGAANDAGYGAMSRDNQRAVDTYARDRARYERELAEWHRAVDACRAGDYNACDR